MPLTTLLAGALLLLTNRVSVQASNCAAAIASVCDDDAETTVCKTIFDPTGTSKCDEPNYKPFLPLCYKSCKSCCLSPKYSCEDNNSIVSIDCNAIATTGGCNTAMLDAVVKQYCPQSCGKCDQITQSCADKNVTACEQIKHLCISADWQQFMIDNCAKTCNMCDKVTTAASATTSTTAAPVVTCVDKASDCAVQVSAVHQRDRPGGPEEREGKILPRRRANPLPGKTDQDFYP